jgi:hypothetical protein
MVVLAGAAVGTVVGMAAMPTVVLVVVAEEVVKEVVWRVKVGTMRTVRTNSVTPRGRTRVRCTRPSRKSRTERGPAPPPSSEEVNEEVQAGTNEEKEEK